MGITWHDSTKSSGQIVTFTDPYTVLEWRDVVLALSERRSPGVARRLLIDARACAPPTAEFVVRALSVLETGIADSPSGRVAVVTSTDAAFAMGRLAEAAVDIRKLPFTLRTFRDWHDAEKWLEHVPSLERV